MQDAGVKSRRQMKLTLRWLKERNHITIRCLPKVQSPEGEGEPWESPKKFAFSKKKRHGTPPPKDKEFVYNFSMKRVETEKD